MLVIQSFEEAQYLEALEYTADDRWLVFGEETQSPAKVLAVMLQCVSEQEMGEA